MMHRLIAVHILAEVDCSYLGHLMNLLSVYANVERGRKRQHLFERFNGTVIASHRPDEVRDSVGSVPAMLPR